MKVRIALKLRILRRRIHPRSMHPSRVVLAQSIQLPMDFPQQMGKVKVEEIALAAALWRGQNSAD